MVSAGKTQEDKMDTIIDRAIAYVVQAVVLSIIGVAMMGALDRYKARENTMARANGCSVREVWENLKYGAGKISQS